MPGIDVETLKSVDTLTCKILVLEGCLDVYKNNDFWGKFKNIEEYDPSIKDSYTITYDLKNISLADIVSIQRNSTLNLTLLALSGTNRLGEIKNDGVLILSSADEQAKLVNTTVENAGIFANSVGLISEVSGTGALAIAPIGDKTVEEGSSIDLMATAVPGESYTSVIFQWQRLENGTWIDKKTTTNTPAPQAISLSLLHAAEPLADSYKVEAPEMGTYRCVITSKVSDRIATTLTTLSKVTVVSSEPDPVVTFSGQLYKAITLPIGETMIAIPQGSYIIRIENQSYKIRF